MKPLAFFITHSTQFYRKEIQIGVHMKIPGIIFNLKRNYSINTHARFPGSLHDSAIWSTSQVNQHMEHNFINDHNSSWLIGGSGYYPIQRFYDNTHFR